MALLNAVYAALKKFLGTEGRRMDSFGIIALRCKYNRDPVLRRYSVRCYQMGNWVCLIE